MKITNITSRTITIPLTTTFKTALRSIDTLENVIVEIQTDTGLRGIGSAAPSPVITGETTSSILGAIEHIDNNIRGMNISEREDILQRVNRCLVGNMSAKAAVDMAIFDLAAQSLNTPLFTLLGSSSREIETDITISLDSPQKMEQETKQRLQQGFNILKIKVGGKPEEDITRLENIAATAGENIKLRIDANQGWSPKEAVYVARQIEKRNIPIELMEQPVAASDYAGLKYVRDNTLLPIYADESIFTPEDALRLIEMKAVDGINIKLMKCGGIYNGLKIAAIAESGGIPCMIGSMMECNISVTAAAHLGAAQSIITKFDLDAPLFCSLSAAEGGISYEGAALHLPQIPGLGFPAQ